MMVSYNVLQTGAPKHYLSWNLSWIKTRLRDGSMVIMLGGFRHQQVPSGNQIWCAGKYPM
jgi:hypothetical protein